METENRVEITRAEGERGNGSYCITSIGFMVGITKSGK